MTYGPLTDRQRRNPSAHRVAKLILPLRRVQRWIERAGADDDLRDRRACSLIAVTADCLANAAVTAKLPSIGTHRDNWLAVARSLSAAASLLSKVEARPKGCLPDNWPRLPDSWTHLREAIETGRKGALAIARSTRFAASANGSNAARNDFVRELSRWIARASNGRNQNAMVADIVRKAFPTSAPTIGAERVRAILRSV